MRYAFLAALFLSVPMSGSLADSLKIVDPRARILLADRPGVVFMEIHNSGPADSLLSAEPPLAARTELHNHIHEDGVMKMRGVEVIDVPAEGVAILKSGSYHIMLFELTRKPAIGERFPLTLHFRKAGKISVAVTVTPLSTSAPKHEAHDTKPKHKAHGVEKMH